MTYGDQGTVMPLGFAVCDAIIAANRDNDFGMVMHVGDLRWVAWACGGGLRSGSDGIMRA